MTEKYDVIIVGAGAAGMMSAIEAGKRGRKVLLVDHAKKIGEKIRISGGGRCNFTNIHTNPNKFISNNPKFVISALKQYTQNNFIDLIKKHNIKFHEKKLGQLFCTTSAKEIINMLIAECLEQNVKIDTEVKISNLSKNETSYTINTSKGNCNSKALVIATGGLSIPKIGATDFGYKIAKQFNLEVNDLSPALVPLTFQEKELEFCKSLAGVSVNASVNVNKTVFDEGLIFTHRGISGPSILQISSYWKQGKPISINLLPNVDLGKTLKQRRVNTPKQNLSNVLSDYLPNKLASAICEKLLINNKIGEASNGKLKKLSDFVNNWIVFPTGTEGYKTAEVTLGGIDTKAISSSTMECIDHPGLFFIGEVLDVTGHLGGHNFQWAWSSGFVAGQNV